MTTAVTQPDATASQGFRVVEIAREPIERYKILKFQGMAGSGGQAKAAVAAGEVRVNGEVELQKRKQIISGDTIEFNDDKIRIKLSSRLRENTSDPEQNVNTDVATHGPTEE